MIYSFITHPGTLRMAHKWWRNKLIRCTTPPPSLLKNLKLNCETNTGHIYMVKHRPESCNSQLSNAPKNINNGWRNQVIRCTTPPALLLKNSKLKFEMNTGHIYKVNHPPKRCDFQLFNAPRNINNGEELVEK